MNIADLIAALQRGEDPSQAIPAQFMPGMAGDSPAATAAMNPGIRPELTQGGFMPPLPTAQAGAPAQAQAQPQAPKPPQGIPTPVTNPQPANESPKIMQSPPDLANMYIELMKKNQNAQALDSGMHLIAAGFSPYMASRVALIQGASGPGRGGGSGVPSAADLIILQKHQQAQKDMLIRRSMLAGLAKQYGLTPESALALETSGKLDEVIKHHETQNLTVVEDSATGQKSFYDHRGKKITDIGGPKPEKGEFVTGPQGPELRSPITGAQVAPGVGLPPTTDQQNIEASMTRINAERTAAGQPPLTTEQYMRTYGKGGVTVNVGAQGQQFPAPPPGQDYRRAADGTVLVDAGTGEPTVYDIPGSDAKIKREEHAAELEKKKLEAAKLARGETKAVEGDLEKARSKYSAVSSVFAAADRSEEIMGNAPWYLPAAGLGSSIGTSFGGSPSTNLRAALKTIESVTAFNQLQSMRDASPTGAALGPVSDFENKMLSATIASVDPNQSPQYLLDGMRRIKASMVVLAENDFIKQAGGDRAKAQALYNDAISKEIASFEKKAGSKAIKGDDVRRVN